MNILLPTDFSACASYAFDIAIQVAQKTLGQLHLYHSADIPDDWEDLEPSEKSADTKNKYIAMEARQKLMDLKIKAEQHGVECRFHYTGGSFLKNIIEILEKVKIDLIVMGSHGVAGKEEWFIGSNTQKVVRKFRKNLLVVKQPNKDFVPQSAVFVTGLNTADQSAFKSFLDYADLFNIREVHVLSIDTSSWFTQPTIVMLEALKDFKKIAVGYNCTAHFYKDYSIQAGIRHFIEEHNIDLVGISYQERNPIKRIFLGSNVEMLINHTDHPLLCINE